MPAVSSVPTNTDALTFGPADNVRTERVNQSRYLVSGNARILDARKGALPCQRVAVTDAACLDLDAYLFGTRPGNFSFDNFESTIWFRNLHYSHF
jgi:hypothetical protein